MLGYVCARGGALESGDSELPESLSTSGRPDVARDSGDDTLAVESRDRELPVSLSTVKSLLPEALSTSGRPEVESESSELPESLSTASLSW